MITNSDGIIGQDVNFNQIFATPHLLNPALTGDIDGTFRVFAINRDQWRPALGKSLKSISFGGDTKFYLNEKSGGKDFLAAGLTFYTDRTALYDYFVNQIAISSAYHKALDYSRNEFITLGLALGVSQWGINYEDILFEDQFNKIDDYNLGTSEDFPPNSLAIPELSLGLHYRKSIRKDRTIFLGVAGFHLIKGEVSFYNNVQTKNTPYSKTNVLLRKYNTYIGMKSRINESLTWSPHIRYSIQSPYQELSIAASARQQFYTSKGVAVHFGAGLQLGNINDNTGLKRVALQAGYETRGLILGLSYDHNIHDFVNKYAGMGSVEFSITYIGEHENDFQFCPTF